MRKKIVDCTGCVLGMSYPPKLRERNLELQNEYAPKGEIKTVILGESPPFRGGYIYDRHTRSTPRTFSYQVFLDLGYIDDNKSASLNEAEKEDLLRRMGGQDSTLVLDCCQCAANHLRGASQDYERDKLVSACFSRYVAGALEAMDKNSMFQIWFKFPPGRGEGLWNALKTKYGERIIRKGYWSAP